MDYRQFTDAILKGTQVNAPESSNAALGNSMTGAFRASALAAPGQAQDVVAQTQAAEEEKRRKAAAEARARELQDKFDPSKYTKVRKDDGGFDFFDPSGKAIDVNTYAKYTGQRRVDAISDSENPVDQQFIDDYKQMNDLNQAVWRNDSATIEAYRGEFPELFSDGATPTPYDVNKKLLEKYPHMFGLGNYQTSQSNLGKPLFRSSMSSAGYPGQGGQTKSSSKKSWQR